MRGTPTQGVEVVDALSPTAFLEDVERRLQGAFDRPVRIVGRIVGTRRARGGWLTLELGDAEPGPGYQTRLSVTLPPQAAAAAPAETTVEQTLVQVTGRVRLWVARAQVQVLATEVVRVGHSQTRATFDAAVAAVAAEDLGGRVPPLPRFLRRIVLLAPVGTTLGDLTRDLGGWQPPAIVHHPIPGDSPDLHVLLERAATQVPDADLLVLARGGAIEAISGWDAVELLRTIDRLQRQGRPVLVAVGHADHTPLVYRVAGYTVRHTAEAGRWLADHNRSMAARIDGLSVLPEVLDRVLERRRDRVAVARRGLRAAVTTHLDRRRAEVTGLEAQLHSVVRGHLGRRDVALRASGRWVVDVLRGRLASVSARHRSASGSLHAEVSRLVADRSRRSEVAAAMLDGFRTGIALLAAEDGGPARLEPGARVRIEVADATAVATVDRVVRHGPAGPDQRPTATTVAAAPRRVPRRHDTAGPSPRPMQLDLLPREPDTRSARE